VFEGEAAAQPAAEPGDAAGAHRQLLVLRHPQGDRLLVRRELAAAVLVAAEAMVAAEAGTLPRADGAELDAPVEAPAELLLQPCQIRSGLGLIRENDPRSVEHELRRDRLQLQVGAAQELAEHLHRLLLLDAVLGRSLLVGRRRASDDPLQRLRQSGFQLVVRLHHAPELLPARRVADHLGVPGELEAVRIERVDLAPRGKHDANRRCHVGNASAPAPGRRARA
jgi:hypothetical protein